MATEVVNRQRRIRIDRERIARLADMALEAAILELLAERDAGETICPSEAAKLVGGTETRRGWEGLMVPARAAARRLVKAGRIVATQDGKVVDASTAKGAIRLRLR